MFPITFRSMMLAAALVTLLSAHAWAQGCKHCGCKSDCNKVCRLVCEEKKVEITCLGVKTEEFCIPGPSKLACKNYDDVCDFAEGGCKDGVCSGPKKFVWTQWIPGCAKIHTKKKLMKRTVTKTIPRYKWVVEDLCGQCENKLPQATVQAGTEVPPLPRLDASVKVHPVCTLPAN